MYCSVDTSTHTNHISKERGNSQQICNEELLGRVGLILNHVAKRPSISNSIVFGYIVNTTLPSSTIIFFNTLDFVDCRFFCNVCSSQFYLRF